MSQEYGNDDVISGTQYFTVDDVTAIAIEDYNVSVAFENNIVTVTYTYSPLKEYRTISSLSELRNDMAYHIKAKSGEGYLAWNSDITDTYISLRGVTNYSHNNLPGNQSVASIYQQEVTPFDNTVIWQILKEGDSYYLYQPAKENYVTRSGRDYQFTDQKTALDKIRDNGDGTFSFHAGGGYSDGSTNFACIVTNEATYAVRNWTWDDHGSVMYIVENPNIEVEDILTSIEDVLSNNATAKTKAMYNMQGQRLQAMPKEGIVIVDGKKKVVRK